MEDIYQWYRTGLLFYGPYRSYFGKSRPASEYTTKIAEYSREPLSSRNSGERERKTQQNEIQPTKTIEIKPENSQKIETTQKLEQKKETPERQNEISPNKIGLPEYQIERQTDSRRKRPANSYERVETGW